MASLVTFAKALADPTRVRVLNALLQTELCVCELTDALQIGQSSLSSHLQILRNSGIVKTEKRQSWIIYSIDPTQRETIENLFKNFPTEDLEEDNQRLAGRIKLRIDGCCVVGFQQALKEEQHR